MTVDGLITRGQSVTTFEAWSPQPPSHEHQFAAALWRLADDSLREEESVRLLEQLHRYLGLGLPVRVTRNAFTTVRLFGGLSTHDEAGLRSTFEELGHDEPLLMDLSNVDSMGTRLYDLFSGLATRKGPTVWLASEGALPHLAAIGVPSSRIFEHRQRAEAALA